MADTAPQFPQVAQFPHPRYVPDDAYTEPLMTRSYEVGRSGAVSPGTILRYLEHLATQASAAYGFNHTWYETHGSAWVVREMELRLGALPGIDDQLRMATWLSATRRVQANREYAIWHQDSGQLVARAVGRWGYVDRYRGVPTRVPDELLNRLTVNSYAMRPHAFTEAPATTTHEFLLTARDYEADSQQHVNNCVYADWLYEALTHAVAASDVTDGRRLVPRYFSLEYLRQVRPGDTIRIETTYARVGRYGVTAWQRAVFSATGEAAFRARSRYLTLLLTA